MGSDAQPDSGRDWLGSMLDGFADSCVHATSMVQRMLAGTYGTKDALADVTLCSGRAAEGSLATIAGVLGVVRPGTARRNPTEVTMTFPVDDVAGTQAGTFRGIGWATQFYLAAGAVTLDATPNTAGSVTLTVSFDQISTTERDRTIIYEGHLIDQNGNPVTPTIRIPKPAH